MQQPEISIHPLIGRLPTINSIIVHMTQIRREKTNLRAKLPMKADKQIIVINIVLINILQ